MNLTQPLLRLLTIAFLVLPTTLPTTLAAQEYQHFSGIVQPTTGTIGWDSFSILEPDNYAGPHAADVIEDNAAGSNLAATPGGFKAGPNLYAFFSTPTWTIQANGLNSGQQFTSVAVQVATTPPPMGQDLNFGSFFLEGLSPDEFLQLGPRAALDAGGGQPPQDVNYYWAVWNGLDASTNYSITIGPGQNHAVFTAARVDYLNSATATNLTAIPEPCTIAVLGLGALGLFIKRRKR